VFFYQAYNDTIADWALSHGKLGGPAFSPTRMTWIKPSFAWALYRSGYASKHNQTRLLRMKVPHAALAALLSECKCRVGGGGSLGRVQWDPARDIETPEPGGREPRRMLRARAIQIGLRGRLSECYVGSIVDIVDVTALAHAVGTAHSEAARGRGGDEAVSAAMAALVPLLPVERSYVPHRAPETLAALQIGDQ